MKPSQKKCPRCGETKDVDEFRSRETSGGRAKPSSYCRPCERAYQREWAARPESAEIKRAYKQRYRERHPDRVRTARRANYEREDPAHRIERARAWREANPDKIKEYARRDSRRWDRLRRTHGISREDYEALYAAQEGRCPICGTELPDAVVRRGETATRPHVDHCHETGRVRGILCGPCNQGIGLMHDDAAIVQAAVDYLTRDYPPITVDRSGVKVPSGPRTHCPKGHPYDAENTRIKSNGSRGCRTCERALDAKRRTGRPVGRPRKTL